MALLTPYKFLTVYMPINNKWVDRLLMKLRTKTGAIMLPATKMRTAMLPYRDEKYLMALVADQNPGVPDKAYWFNFFGVPTPFVKGPEKGAKVNNCAVVFAFITKTKRGQYVAHLELATTESQILPETSLTEMYVRYLEKVVRANPDMWLWTHRRWKHQWKPEYGEVIS
jgi:KDO2-lipid IV(A) lauroyltransferase